MFYSHRNLPKNIILRSLQPNRHENFYLCKLKILRICISFLFLGRLNYRLDKTLRESGTRYLVPYMITFTEMKLWIFFLSTMYQETKKIILRHRFLHLVQGSVNTFEICLSMRLFIVLSHMHVQVYVC